MLESEQVPYEKDTNRHLVLVLPQAAHSGQPAEGCVLHWSQVLRDHDPG